MATKIRKDPRGRILRKGEGFRPDKNTYIFQYMDPLGRHHTIYAKDIVELRKKEDSMEKDRLDGIRTYIAGETTLNYAFDRYLALKYDLKPSTKTNYLYIYEHFVRKRIGKKLIKDLRYSDIRRYYNQLIVKEGVSPSTVENIHTLINPVLSMAVRDGIIRNNPADGLMKEMKRSSLWRKGERHPLSIEESTAFLNYVESSPIYNHWLTLFVVFFGTGMRVSEVCGLRWEDIDFDKNEINVNHTIVYRKYPDEETGSLHVSTTKSEKGNRVIPMVGEVKDALLAEYKYQQRVGFNSAEVERMKGFIFCSRYGRPYHQAPINKAIHRIVRDYNAEEIARAGEEDREPLLLPHFSCHHIRHTFATRLCENESNVKAIQEIMGHADIETTLNVYAEATKAAKQKAIDNLQEGWKIF